jgi:hypothetical protein
MSRHVFEQMSRHVIAPAFQAIEHELSERSVGYNFTVNLHNAQVVIITDRL